jgi:hypothetical protein
MYQKLGEGMVTLLDQRNPAMEARACDAIKMISTYKPTA